MCQTVIDQVQMFSMHGGMDHDDVDPLLHLFDKGVAKDRPGNVRRFSSGLGQCLIQRAGTDRYGAVAQQPIAVSLTLDRIG